MNLFPNPGSGTIIRKPKNYCKTDPHFNVRLIWKNLENVSDDISAMLELSEEENDPSLLTEIKSSLTDLDDQVTEAEFKALLSEKNDFSNAFVAINSGAGGTESQDWADMLLRMYLRWSDRNGFKAEVLDTQYGEEAGIKSATVLLLSLIHI